LISMALASVLARGSPASMWRIVAIDRDWSRLAAVPAQPLLLVQLIEACSPGGVDHRQPRDAGDQAQARAARERLAERAGVAEVPAGHDDPVGHLPAQRLQHAVHDRLLPFQPEGVDAVDQVDAEFARRLADAPQGVVEVAGDLQGQRAVIQRLRQLAVGDLAGADEDDGPHQARVRA
jgi:hypothetical protein